MRKLFFMTFFIICCVLTSVLPTGAKPVKFAVVSDVHISYKKPLNNSNTVGMTETIDNLQKTVKLLNESDVDFVVFCGDSVKSADKTSSVVFAKIINNLNKPYYVGLGNYDVAQVSGMDKKEFYHLVNMFSHNKIRKLPYLTRGGEDLVFIFMDGVNEFIPGTKGFFKENELLWLDKKLVKYKNKKVVIIQHFPLVAPLDKPSLETYNKDEYLKLLGEHNNVLSVISGHYGVDDEFNQDGVKHISVPSLKKTGEFELIEIEKKNSDKYIIKTKIIDVN